MPLVKNENFSDYDNYLTDENPTTSAQAQDFFKNQATLLKAVIDANFWQPSTNYKFGDVVRSDSMPRNAEAMCISANGGVSSNVEPSWGDVGGFEIADGTCYWKLRYSHWSSDIATEEEAKKGENNEVAMTPLRTKQFVGEVVSDNYFPLSGGTVTGIVESTTNYFPFVHTKKDINKSFRMGLNADNSASGIYITDNNKSESIWRLLFNENTGVFKLGAVTSPTEGYVLEGRPTGGLYWNNEVVGGFLSMETGADFNSFTESGLYYSSYANRPNNPIGASINGFLVVKSQGGNSGYCTQTFYQTGEAGSQRLQIYYRKMSGGVWSKWGKDLVTEAELESTGNSAGYVQLNNGLKIQWGSLGAGNDAYSHTITYPVPFSGWHTYAIVASERSEHTRSLAVDKQGTTYSIVYCSAQDNIEWIAIGF